MSRTAVEAQGDPPDDPRDLTEDWRLPDGTAVRIRPIRPQDLALETAFVEGLSADTSYHRLLSRHQLQPQELWRFTHIDHEREMALVATARIDGAEQLLAVARYVRDAQGDQAEFAIVVGDAWQGSGLGTKLMRGLIAAATRAGVRRLVDVTLSESKAMLALAGRLGFRLQHDPGDARVTRLELAFPVRPAARAHPGARADLLRRLADAAGDARASRGVAAAFSPRHALRPLGCVRRHRFKLDGRPSAASAAPHRTSRGATVRSEVDHGTGAKRAGRGPAAGRPRGTSAS